MAEIFVLPNASATAVVQERTTGRLPKSVVSLRKVRMERLSLKLRIKDLGERAKEAELITQHWRDYAICCYGEIRGVESLLVDMRKGHG